MIWNPAFFQDPNAPLLLFLDYYNRRKDHRHAWRIRNTRYYISAGIGGAAAALLVAFVGRAVSASLQEDKQNRPGGVSLIVPPDFFTPAGLKRREQSDWRLGLAMKF